MNKSVLFASKNSNVRYVEIIKMERVAGIEPACAAWKAAVLPLNYTRAMPILSQALQLEVSLSLWGSRLAWTAAENKISFEFGSKGD